LHRREKIITMRTKGAVELCEKKKATVLPITSERMKTCSRERIGEEKKEEAGLRSVRRGKKTA